MNKTTYAVTVTFRDGSTRNLIQDGVNALEAISLVALQVSKEPNCPPAFSVTLADF